MNNKRRSRLRTAIGYLMATEEIIYSVHSEEEDALNNIPENLEDSDRYSEIEDNVDTLEEVSEGLAEVLEKIRSIRGI